LKLYATLSHLLSPRGTFFCPESKFSLDKPPLTQSDPPICFCIISKPPYTSRGVGNMSVSYISHLRPDQHPFHAEARIHCTGSLIHSQSRTPIIETLSLSLPTKYSFLRVRGSQASRAEGTVRFEHSDVTRVCRHRIRRWERSKRIAFGNAERVVEQ
jgi:hypothetical protein